jgi:hypothetical protein
MELSMSYLKTFLRKLRMIFAAWKIEITLIFPHNSHISINNSIISLAKLICLRETPVFKKTPSHSCLFSTELIFNFQKLKDIDGLRKS